MSVHLADWPAALPPHRLLRPGDGESAVLLRQTAEALRRQGGPAVLSHAMALLAAAACDEVAIAIERRDRTQGTSS